MTIPFLGKRKVYPTKKDLEKLLQCSDIDHPPSLAEMEQPTLNQLNELDTGSVAFIYEEGKTGVRFTENLSHNFGKFIFKHSNIIVCTKPRMAWKYPTIPYILLKVCVYITFFRK